MLKIENNIGALVASETQGALSSLDNAILSKLRLCTTLVEAFDETRLPVGASQKLLQSMANGISHVVQGRGEMASAVRTLSAIKSGSSLAETSYNCPGEPPVFLQAQNAEMAKDSAEVAFG